MPAPDRILLLVRGEDVAPAELPQLITHFSPGSWLFLSPDLPLYLSLRERIDSDIAFGNRADLLQGIARDSRNAYVDFIGQLSRQYAFPGWWLTSLSERNPYVSRTFLHFCHLRMLEGHIGQSEGNVLVICPDESLAAIIARQFQGRAGIRVEHHPAGRWQGSRRIRGTFRGIRAKLVFVGRFLPRILLAALPFPRGRREVPEPADGNTAVIHTWTDARALEISGSGPDTYFGVLESELRKRGIPVSYLRSILPTVFYPRLLWRLRETDRLGMVLEDLLSPLDPFRALWQVLFHNPIPEQCPPFEGVDLSRLIQDECREDRYRSFRSEQSFLFYLAGRRLAQEAGTGTVFYTFENHMWEKMFCAGIREGNPNVRLIGYAHALVSPMYLFYTRSRYEATMPLPDLIAVNGQRARDELVRSGFPEERIVVTGALRYGGETFGKGPSAGIPRENIILVTPTSGLSETLELLVKARDAFLDDSEVRVIVKLHPQTPAGILESFLASLPSHFSVSAAPVTELLSSCHLLLYTESATAIEALARGIPVLHVRSDFRIDMDFCDDPAVVPSAGTAAEIRSRAARILGGEVPAVPPGFVSGFFGPLDDAGINALLEHR